MHGSSMTGRLAHAGLVDGQSVEAKRGYLRSGQRLIRSGGSDPAMR